MRFLIIGAACVAIGIGCDALFLPHQSLWNDEATQLAGLSLGPAEVTSWLAGRTHYDFGVPEDRMPPLSYWAGWAWSRVFGLGERPLRWFGVACVTLATAIVFEAARRAWGLPSGIAGALLLATSPNVIVQAVEIRAYPMLILMSAGVFACLMGYASGPEASRRRWLAGMLACGVAALYTHFYGLVALGGGLVAAFVVAWGRRESVWPVVGAGVLAMILALGLGPFALASATHSKLAGGPSAGKVAVDRSAGKGAALLRLATRQFSHPALSVSTAAVGVAALGFAAGMGCALAPKRRSGWASTALLAALASGGGVVVLAHLAQSAFEAAKVSYSVWMLPPLALLIASGLAANARAVRVASVVAITLLLGANSFGAGVLAVHGDAFAHTPNRPISAQIRRVGPTNVAVIHDGESGQAWHIYAPIRYEFGGKVRQFRYVPGAADAGGVIVEDYPGGKAEFDPIGLDVENLIVVRSVQKGAKEIASEVREGVVVLGDGPVAKALLASGKWERIEERTYLAFVGADVDVFRRVAPHSSVDRPRVGSLRKRSWR